MTGARAWRETMARRYPRERRAAQAALLDALAARAPPPGVLLDLGAGDGALARAARERGWRAAALDLDPDEGLAADFASLPVRPGSARAVAYCASLHHARDVQAALREAARALSPGGAVGVALSPVHERAEEAEEAAAAARRAIPGYAHLTRAALTEALRAAGLEDEQWLDPGLGARFAWSRRVKRALTGRAFADFPLVVARKP